MCTLCNQFTFIILNYKRFRYMTMSRICIVEESCLCNNNYGVARSVGCIGNFRSSIASMYSFYKLDAKCILLLLKLSWFL